MECSTREQRLLNADGSTRRIVPPSMTADEQAEAEVKKRQLEAERAAQQDAIRRDRNLMSRYPNEAAHNKARDAALNDVQRGLKVSEDRLADLQRERKPLLDEIEFYKNKKLPAKLRSQLDANDAAAAAQRSLVQNQRDEIDRLEALYDGELVRLKRLWAGTPAGSMGTLQAPASGVPTVSKTAGK